MSGVDHKCLTRGQAEEIVTDYHSYYQEHLESPSNVIVLCESCRFMVYSTLSENPIPDKMTDFAEPVSAFCEVEDIDEVGLEPDFTYLQLAEKIEKDICGDYEWYEKGKCILIKEKIEIKDFKSLFKRLLRTYSVLNEHVYSSVFESENECPGSIIEQKGEELYVQVFIESILKDLIEDSERVRVIGDEKYYNEVRSALTDSLGNLPLRAKAFIRKVLISVREGEGLAQAIKLNRDILSNATRGELDEIADIFDDVSI